MLNALLDFFINFFWLIAGPLLDGQFWQENLIYAVAYFQAGGNMIPGIGIKQMFDTWAIDNASK